MAKEYTYRDSKTNKVLFETIAPNYMTREDIDKQMLKQTGRDPRLDPFVDCVIRVINDPPTRGFGIRGFRRY